MSIVFFEPPQIFFLLTEHSMVTTSLLPNWASHFFISDVESFSSLNNIPRAGGGIGTNSLSKKSLRKSQRPFSRAHCLIFALFLLTVLLWERKEEGRKLPGRKGAGSRLNTVQAEQLRGSQSPSSSHPADTLEDPGNTQGPWAASTAWL